MGTRHARTLYCARISMLIVETIRCDAPESMTTDHGVARHARTLCYARISMLILETIRCGAL